MNKWNPYAKANNKNSKIIEITYHSRGISLKSSAKLAENTETV